MQEATREYRDLVDSKLCKTSSIKENYQDQYSIPKEYTTVIYKSDNKSLKQVDFNSCNCENDSSFEVESSSRSNFVCCKCGKKGN